MVPTNTSDTNDGAIDHLAVAYVWSCSAHSGAFSISASSKDARVEVMYTVEIQSKSLRDLIEIEI